MDIRQLEEILYKRDIIEEIINDKEKLASLISIFPIQKNESGVYTFSKSSQDIIEIQKQPRYLKIPTHVQDYFEISYVYSGQGKYVLNNKEYNLNKGSIVFLDEKVLQTISASSWKDIIINIMIDKKFLTNDLVDNLTRNSKLKECILRAGSPYSRHENYVIISIDSNEKSLISLVQMILLEYYEAHDNSNIIISNATKLLFMISSRQKYQISNLSNDRDSKSSVDYEKVVSYIQDHYSTVSLIEVSQVFGFNPTYLSRVLKKNTGKTFKQIQVDERLSHAKTLLENTSLPVNDIMLIIGMSNLNYFYKKFKEKYKKPVGYFRTR